MSLALDSNVCVVVLRRRDRAVRARLRAAIDAATPVAVSTLVVHELVVGALRSAQSTRNQGDVARLLAGLTILPFDHDDAQASAAIGEDLRRRGLPIGGYDLLIAAQALRRGLTLVTSNTREFSRVPGLALENWLE